MTDLKIKLVMSIVGPDMDKKFQNYGPAQTSIQDMFAPFQGMQSLLRLSYNHDLQGVGIAAYCVP